MAVSRLMASGTGASSNTGLSGCDSFVLSPVRGGVGGTREARVDGFEKMVRPPRGAMRVVSIRPETRIMLPFRPTRLWSIELRGALVGGDANVLDQSGENAFGVSGNVCRFIDAPDIDSPLELCNGVGIELFSSERRPNGRGGGGPAERSRAIWSGKLSSRSGESTGVSAANRIGPTRVEVGVGAATLDATEG